MAARNGARKTEIQFNSAYTTLFFNFLLLVANVLWVPISTFPSTMCNLLFITLVNDLVIRISSETLVLISDIYATSTATIEFSFSFMSYVSFIRILSVTLSTSF